MASTLRPGSSGPQRLLLQEGTESTEEDRTSSFAGPYDEILHAIHGFRMPLFFLLSGLFTAMLWRRRGLGRCSSSG